MYCIYTDENIPDELANREHIIPLSLGGSNGFEIFVNSQKNATLGSNVDGALSNEFITLFYRQKYDARGHSKKEPYPIAKHSKIIQSGKPVQASFTKEGLKIYSPIDKRYLAETEKSGIEIESILKIDPYLRMRFTAKVALASGYFIYGDVFRTNVKHYELRSLMEFDKITSKKDDFIGFETKGWFWPFPIEDKDVDEYNFFQFLAEYLDCSFVISIPGTSNILLIIGLMGNVVGIINCPSNKDEFPQDGDHDLGHVIAIKNSNIVRMSYRELSY